MAQKALNKLGESGTTDRINSAMAKKNATNDSLSAGKKASSLAQGISNKPSEESEDTSQEQGEGFANFEIPEIVKIWILASLPAVLTCVVFICVLLSGSQVVRNVANLDNANTSSNEALEKVDNKDQEDIDKEMEGLDEDDVAFNYNITIQRKKYAIPYFLVDTSKTTKDVTNKDSSFMDDLEDYYGLDSDSETITKFYNKLNHIYNRYKLKTSVKLDIPLLMSTLMVGSKDMDEIFKSNTLENYDDDPEVLKDREIVHDLDFDKDWSNYRITRKNSAHDIEILAQNMVSVDSNGRHKLDYEKYDEFLKEFLEKKYYIDENSDGTLKDGNYVGDLTFVNSNFGDVVYYNQGDYGKYYFSSDPANKNEYSQGGSPATIQSHGCGPVSLAIILSSILEKQIGPVEVTSKYCSAGGCTSSGGKYQQLITVAQNYGVKATTTANNQEVLNALGTNNSLVIVLMGPGTFTPSGHFIVLTGTDSNGKVSVADPGSRARTNQKWFSFNTVVEQRKTYAPYMIFSR